MKGAALFSKIDVKEGILTSDGEAKEELSAYKRLCCASPLPAGHVKSVFWQYGK